MVNQQPPHMALPPNHKRISLFVAIIMSVLFVGTLIFAIWAFMGMVENQSDLDAKIEAASKVAVEQAQEEKEIEFTEREKDPFKTYQGATTYGSLTFSYPKSWSIYVETSDRSTLLDFYAQPDLIPGFDDTRFAFRAQIIDRPYENELAAYDRSAERGDVQVQAFRLEKLPEQLGAIITGEIRRNVQGTLVLLPQRDKTIKLFTESEDHGNDFSRILQSTSYIP